MDVAQQRPWHDLARTAALRLQGASHGERRQILEQLASESGHEPSTLRSMVKTLSFVEELRSSDPALADLAEHCSHAFLSVFERWSHYDPIGARKALRDHSGNPMQLRSLVSREKAARQAATSQPTRDSPHILPISSHDLPSLLNQTFQGGWEREPLRDVLQQQPPHWRTLPSLQDAADAYRRSSGYIAESRRPRLEWVKPNEQWRRRRVTAVALDDTWTPVAAAFEVKPHASWKLLRDRAPEFILRAYGLRRVVELVLIILPDLRAAEVFDSTDLGPDYTNGSHDVWRFYRSS
jgi:hypothetical protein